MELKEKIEALLEDEETKELWRGIYEAFTQDGKDGIETFLKSKVDDIKNRFNDNKQKVEKQIGVQL